MGDEWRARSEELVAVLRDGRVPAQQVVELLELINGADYPVAGLTSVVSADPYSNGSSHALHDLILLLRRMLRVCCVVCWSVLEATVQRASLSLPSLSPPSLHSSRSAVDREHLTASRGYIHT